MKLRPWDMSDLETLVMYANNWNVAKNLTDKFPYPYTENDGKEFIKYTTRSKNLIFAIEVDGQAVGSIGIHPLEDIYRKNAELGYWLAESFWGKN
jgi:RimJ/RimL family protein N-acetyltransferase